MLGHVRAPVCVCVCVCVYVCVCVCFVCFACLPVCLSVCLSVRLLLVWRTFLFGMVGVRVSVAPSIRQTSDKAMQQVQLGMGIPIMLNSATQGGGEWD